MRTFTHLIADPADAEADEIRVEVTYEMRDVGVDRPLIRPVLLRVEHGGADLLKRLPDAACVRLEAEATLHDADQRALTRFGPEAV